MSICAETEWEMNNGLFQKNTSYKVSIQSWNTPSAIINKVLMQNVAFVMRDILIHLLCFLRLARSYLLNIFFKIYKNYRYVIIARRKQLSDIQKNNRLLVKTLALCNVLICCFLFIFPCISR